MTRGLHVGIDLGTTNSAAAVFDGEQVSVVRNRHGGVLTPSVVRIDAKGNATVGERARRLLDSDPDNVRSEFKRLMGTDRTIDFPASGLSKRPQDLAALVLESLRRDVLEQEGVEPKVAAISVPALFELPQIAATSEAARLAGFDRIEVIQEPVASAIAAGWQATDSPKAWLVYDLGGGTFDATLLQEQEGLLRVAGHDGDNFLGGRDFDAAIVAHVLSEMEAAGDRLDRADPQNATALRRLRFAAEEAKIELTRATEASILLPGLFHAGGRSVSVDATIDRETLARLVTPLIDRSIAACLRLLRSCGMQPADLGRVVLVGGPTVMPVLRERVAQALGAPFGEGLDPMLLVAKGAALHAAAMGLDARAAAPAPVAQGPRAWLQHPAVTSDAEPFVVGRILDRGDVRAVRIERADGAWSSADEALDADAAFAIPVALVPRRANEFRILGIDAKGAAKPLAPPSFRIVHGVSIGDPPLSRSIGVALADGTVKTYFERGSPLPMRRSFEHETILPVARGDSGFALRIPVVQGEMGIAKYCRLVGTIEIRGSELRAPIPAGTAVQVTLELDRGGRLSGRALIPSLEQEFEQVAHLVVSSLTPDALEEAVRGVAERVAAAEAAAMAEEDRAAMELLADAARLTAEAEADLESARGGDADAAEKARRAVIEADAQLAEWEQQRAWPEVVERANHHLRWVAAEVNLHGNEAERQLVADGIARVRQLVAARKAAQLERVVRDLRRLGNSCYFRSPGAYRAEFPHLAERIDEAGDRKRAQELVAEGREALRRGDDAAVQRIFLDLWNLMPPQEEERRLSQDSGIR